MEVSAHQAFLESEASPRLKQQPRTSGLPRIATDLLHVSMLVLRSPRFAYSMTNVVQVNPSKHSATRLLFSFGFQIAVSALYLLAVQTSVRQLLTVVIEIGEANL